MTINFTVRLPKELVEMMRKHKEVNWSQVIRKSIEDYLKKLVEIEKKEDPSKLIERLSRLGVTMDDLKPLSYRDEIKLYKEVLRKEWRRLSYIT